MNGRIYVWPVEPSDGLTSENPEPIKALKFMEDGRLLALRGLSIDQWDVAAKTSKTILTSLKTASALAVDRSGKRAAVGPSEESAIMVFDLASGEPIAELDQPME